MPRPHKVGSCCHSGTGTTCTDARAQGLIPEGLISDQTRPFVLVEAFDTVGAFLQKYLRDELLAGYHRDLLRSQPAYVELLSQSWFALRSLSAGLG
jgi:hypothetical protein